LPAGLQAWNAGEGLQAQVTGSVQLLEKLGRSEMNIALQAEALGAVQVHTHVSGDQVAASITVDRHDVHALLASDLPALHQALGDRQLRLDSISLQHSALLGAGTAFGDNAARQQSQQGSSWQTPFQGESQAGVSLPATPMLNWEAPGFAEARPIFDSQGRLSVRA
jgi:flagellar hook-length control protein FliK